MIRLRIWSSVMRFSSDSGPHIFLPPPNADKPPWAKVGLIAALGFSVGIGWPLLAGLRLGPTPPNEAHSSSSNNALADSKVPSAIAPSLALTTPISTATNEETITWGPSTVASCRDAKGERPSQCASIALDSVVLPPLKNLSKCPSALGLAGKLSVGFTIDFGHKTIKVERGRSTTLPNSTVDGVLRCVEKSLAGISLENVAHTEPRTTVFYAATFYPPGKTPEATTAAPPPSERIPTGDEARTAAAGSDTSTGATKGSVTEVTWPSCVVRDAPRTGEVKGRLVRGMKVRTVEQKGDWYHVQYGSPSQEGWVYRSALGL